MWAKVAEADGRFWWLYNQLPEEIKNRVAIQLEVNAMDPEFSYVKALDAE